MDDSPEHRPPELVPRLVEEFGYTAEGARVVARAIDVSAPSVRDIFRHWWKTGEILPIEIEGYTVRLLMNDRGMNPIAALLTLDWLLRKPEDAKLFLAKPHDLIVFDGEEGNP